MSDQTEFSICPTAGMNEDGQCGAGHELPIVTPSKVDFLDAGPERYAVSVSCGHSHTGELRK